MITENLKQLRKERQITQDEVCAMLSVSRNCYASWEQGRTEPNLSMLIRLADIFEVSIDYLLGRATALDIVNITTDLTPQQKELLHNFDKLNTEGKARLLGYLVALLGMPIYCRK